MNIQADTEKLLEQRNQFIHEVVKQLDLIAKIKNQETTPINKNCYTVSSSAVQKHGVLSPEFYSFADSCRLIKKHMPNDAVKLAEFLQKMVNNKRITEDRKPFNMPLHPDLITLICQHFTLEETKNPAR